MSDDDFLKELIKDFIDQVQYSLTDCEESFLNLENSKNKSVELTQIFRLAHSIKGGASVIGFEELALFAHHVEDLLSVLRAYPEDTTPNVVSLLLKCLDKFKERTAEIEAGNMANSWDPSEISREVIMTTKRLESQRNIEKNSPPASSEAHLKPTENTEDATKEPTIQEAPTRVTKANSTVKVDTARIDSVLDLVGELVVIKSQLIQEVRKEIGRASCRERVYAPV